MTISFDVVDAPSRSTEKDITENPYWAVIEKIKDLDGKAATFAIPTEDGDTFKRATGRTRVKLNEVSEHLDRTIRATFAEKDGKILATVWVMGKKIRQPNRKKKNGQAAAETTVETPAETPVETPAAGRRGNRRAAA